MALARRYSSKSQSDAATSKSLLSTHQRSEEWLIDDKDWATYKVYASHLHCIPRPVWHEHSRVRLRNMQRSQYDTVQTACACAMRPNAIVASVGVRGAAFRI